MCSRSERRSSEAPQCRGDLSESRRRHSSPAIGLVQSRSRRNAARDQRRRRPSLLSRPDRGRGGRREPGERRDADAARLCRLHRHRVRARSPAPIAATPSSRRRRRVPAASLCARCCRYWKAIRCRPWAFIPAASVHYMTEAMRFAYRDRNTYLGDPAFVAQSRRPIAVRRAHAKAIRARIAADRATPSASLGHGAAPTRTSDHHPLFGRRTRSGNAVVGHLHHQ